MDGRIGDNAEVLSPEFEEEMIPRLAAIEEKTDVTVLLVSLPTLGPADASKVATKIGELAADTGKTKEDWIVFLLAPAERVFTATIRHSVANEEIKSLTDEEKRALLEDIANVFTPAVTHHFKDGHWEEGMRAGVEAIESLLGSTDTGQPLSELEETQS
ncbi:MAG: TPM domain-containing protein [Erythrobacter sp.]